MSGPAADPRKQEMTGLIHFIRLAHERRDFKRRDELIWRYDSLALDLYQNDSPAAEHSVSKEK